MYAVGDGVPQDYEEALKWHQLAAKQGDVFAQISLGEMYAKGRGVQRDFVQAHVWYNLAGMTDEDARENRDIVAESMTPEQIAEAQRLAREWMQSLEANEQR